MPVKPASRRFQLLDTGFRRYDFRKLQRSYHRDLMQNLLKEIVALVVD